MNKIILQIGALAFFVSLVAFSTERFPLLDTVARAFIVFIIVTLALSVLLALMMLMVSKGAKAQKEQARANTNATQSAA